MMGNAQAVPAAASVDTVVDDVAGVRSRLSPVDPLELRARLSRTGDGVADGGVRTVRHGMAGCTAQAPIRSARDRGCGAEAGGARAAAGPGDIRAAIAS